MIILVGKSATGKTEVAKKLIEKYNFKKMITTTTRKMRDGEVQDRDYHFISNEEFLRRIDNHEFLEYVKYSNSYYGTNRNDVSSDKVLIVEVSGCNAIYRELKDECTIFYIDSSYDVRKKRMENRGDKEEDIKVRLDNDDIVFDKSKINHIDFIVDSDKYTIEEMADIIYSYYK